ncbi:hypothetical protein EII34_14315 [Arachnia propionica]|uniref:Uncharacterized protein n=1 Tax=Arachnia propionica TaxID=1750 RepID=A0A3P1T1Y5_9ACTN|nr:hypothetical protein [Arachnia propionica]RRD03364.1 hypothetical protein EII34_14315 [Arachnia propionica]
MKRRDFLTTSALISVALGATSCSDDGPDPVDAPSPEGFPSHFATGRVWPPSTSILDSRITAVKDRYLTGMASVPKAQQVFLGGWAPVLVDLTGPTTWVVVVDDKGAWRTRRVKLEPLETKDREPRSAHTGLVAGPAAIDDQHAYLVLGVRIFEEPRSERVMGVSLKEDVPCQVVLLKLRLTDGAVVASLTVSDSHPARAVEEHLHLSFSEDGTRLLLAGGTVPDRRDRGTDWVGMRITTADLTVEFDARTVFLNRQVVEVTPAGQGVIVLAEGQPTAELVLLSDGSSHQLDLAGGIVIGTWLWLLRGNRDDTHLVVADLVSGQQTEIPDSATASPTWPRIHSGATAVIDFKHEEHLMVWRPGEHTPAWSSTGRDRVPHGVAVLGDLMHIWYENGASHIQEIWRLGDAEPLARHVENAFLSSGVQAITPWGVTSEDSFVLATRWLDQSPTPTASPS